MGWQDIIGAVPEALEIASSTAGAQNNLDKGSDGKTALSAMGRPRSYIVSIL